MMVSKTILFTSLALASTATLSTAWSANDQPTLKLEDTFDLEMASGPVFSPDGKTLIYHRRSFDIMTDRSRSNIWIMNSDGSAQRPLLSGKDSFMSATFSPDGSRLAYIATHEGKPQIYVRWMDSGQTARITDLQSSPSGITWSPDGQSIAFSSFVPEANKPFTRTPRAPKGAKWAPAPKVIEKDYYRADGRGYLPDGHSQLFVVPATGGTPRQITSGAYNSRGEIAWTKDGKNIIFSSNRRDDAWEHPRESELYQVSVENGNISQLTDRDGPDRGPALSPDGKKLAWTGYDDIKLSSQTNYIYIRDLKGGEPMKLTAKLDRSAGNLQWGDKGKYLYFQYTDHGRPIVARVDLKGNISKLTDEMGGMSMGRPYAAGTFTVGKGGQVAFTYNNPMRPADLAIMDTKGKVTRVTDLNADLLDHKYVSEIKEINIKSSVDGRAIQGWVAYPPNYDKSKKHPLMLEIHGGPHSAYGPSWSTEIQLFAAAGYVVLYTNPRGSTSYGQEFANLIHHCYPCGDYDDLMDLVDATIDQESIDTNRLYVTGGSGGGVLTSWIIGKTDRFKAAVVAKPVINWTSFALTADGYSTYTRYWLNGMPWDNHDHYWKRSPLSLVGNVKTPTMLMVGEQDYRTPASESEQYYQALRLRNIPSAMVRIQNSGHGIASKPSNLINKVAYILEWFDRYK